MVKIRRKLVVNKPRKWGSVVVRVPWSRLIQSAKYDVNQWIMLIDKEMWDPNDPGAPSVQWDTIACLNELKRQGEEKVRLLKDRIRGVISRKERKETSAQSIWSLVLNLSLDD